MRDQNISPGRQLPLRAAVFVGLLFFSSGAIGLVYEVLWQRQFSLLFGNSAAATATVLAAYFGGLAIGSFLFGRMDVVYRRPLVAYAFLEIAIGLGALLVQPILELYSAWYPAMIARYGTEPRLLLMIKASLGFAAIALPTVAMGGTLPALSNAVVNARNELGARVAALYVLNTFGATIGALAFPLLLLPGLGLRHTSLLCASGNVLIGIASLLLARSFHPRRAATGTAPVILRSSAAPPILALSFISGAGIFALQVMWNRAFAQVHENSLRAFAFITAGVIVSIAGGSLLARSVLKRGVPARRFLKWCWMTGGVLTVAAPFLFVQLTGGFGYISVSGLSGRYILLVITAIILPVTLLASALPLLIQELSAATQSRSSDVTGSMLAVNTLGCIAGALLAGFVLPQLSGLWKGVSVVGILFVALGANISEESLRSLRPAGRIQLRRLVPLALLACVLSLELPRTFLGRSDQLLALKEGPHGIAAVVQKGDGSRRLKLNNHYVLGGTLSTGDQRMQAHIPLLLQPSGQRAVFLGYGTGITAGGVLFHPRFFGTAVELVPEVAQLAAEYFGEANGRFAAHPKASLVLDDARNFLLGSHEKYDVIAGDLVVPWRPGEGSLYTVEHFRAARSSLSEEGLFCAWIPMFQVSEREFQIIARTFLEVFGHAFLWRGDFSPDEPAYGLVAFKRGDEGFAPSQVTAALPQMQPDESNPQLGEPAAFWMHFIGRIGGEILSNPPPPVNSEDRPWLEVGRAHGGARREGKFIGRALSQWETTVRERSRGWIETLPREVRSGWSAGAMMVEFTQLIREKQHVQAVAVQRQIRDQLGDRAFALVFGQ